MTDWVSVKDSECACEKCSSMCKAPCCGTPSEMDLLIKIGYGNRLMCDDWPDEAIMLKPALKGYEGQRAPWDVSSEEGCTFWKDGKCELHELKLKPSQGRLAHHSLAQEEKDEVCRFIRDSWSEDKGTAVIKKWKEIANKEQA